MADVSVDYSEYSDDEDVYTDGDDSGSEFDENSPAVKAGKGKKAATTVRPSRGTRRIDGAGMTDDGADATATATATETATTRESRLTD